MKTSQKNANKNVRVWTQKDSAEFAQHLADRGFTIVKSEQMTQQNEFIAQVTQGLNVGDPKNQGRQIAVVWKDHLDLLNTVAKCVLKLGMTQAKMDTALETGDTAKIAELNGEMKKARDVLESLADHLADKEKEAVEAVRYFGGDGKEVIATSEPIST